MYEEFRVTDRWSGEELHCTWKGTMVAIATRHADAVDVRFDVNGRPMWIALPLEAWVPEGALRQGDHRPACRPDRRPLPQAIGRWKATTPGAKSTP